MRYSYLKNKCLNNFKEKTFFLFDSFRLCAKGKNIKKIKITVNVMADGEENSIDVESHTMHSFVNGFFFCQSAFVWG
jgi:hypothetical protein